MPALTEIKKKFPSPFFILHGVKIKIMHSIAPVNLQLSIKVTGMSWCPNVCPIVLYTSDRAIFTHISAIANSAIQLHLQLYRQFMRRDGSSSISRRRRISTWRDKKNKKLKSLCA